MRESERKRRKNLTPVDFSQVPKTRSDWDAFASAGTRPDQGGSISFYLVIRADESHESRCLFLSVKQLLQVTKQLSNFLSGGEASLESLPKVAEGRRSNHFLVEQMPENGFYMQIWHLWGEMGVGKQTCGERQLLHVPDGDVSKI